ncbi:MAG: lysophospholipid acyltransferase family protein [Verrucomicrobiota bacterium]
MSTALPARKAWKVRFFQAYLSWYLGRNFNGIRQLGPPPSFDPENESLVLYANHPSWWDPLLFLFLVEHHFPGVPVYGPIDAEALERYGIFQGLGFFGVDQHSPASLRSFLRTGQAILSQPGRLLVLTPEGNFADPRVRPLEFQVGLEQLARRAPEHVRLAPLALELVHWEERLPEACYRIGPAEPPQARCNWKPALTQTLDELQQATQKRDPSLFLTSQEGKSGLGGLYGLWRRLIRGDRDLRHGSVKATQNDRPA